MNAQETFPEPLFIIRRVRFPRLDAGNQGIDKLVNLRRPRRSLMVRPVPMLTVPSDRRGQLDLHASLQGQIDRIPFMLPSELSRNRIKLIHDLIGIG